LPGVWATGQSLEECRNHLREVIEGWILVRWQKGLSVPALGNKRLGPVKEIQVKGALFMSKLLSRGKAETG
jgi:predicted RNase H-like HicB family nuclease